MRVVLLGGESVTVQVPVDPGSSALVIIRGPGRSGLEASVLVEGGKVKTPVGMVGDRELLVSLIAQAMNSSLDGSSGGWVSERTSKDWDALDNARDAGDISLAYDIGMNWLRWYAGKDAVGKNPFVTDLKREED